MRYAFAITAGLVLNLLPIASGQESNFRPESNGLSSLSSASSLSRTSPVSLSASRPAMGPATFDASDAAFSTAYGEQQLVKIRNNFKLDINEQSKGLTLEPRFQKRVSNDSGLSSYSAEIRLGNVSFEKADQKPTGWYVFAAADGEALSFNTSSITRSDDNMTITLDDQITVGDLQAGISTYVGGTQLTFSYIETEASFSAPGGISNSKKEAFAGFSLAREF